VKHLMNILYIVLSVAPFSFIRFYPFKDKLRVSVKILCVIFAFIIGTQAVLFDYLSWQPFWSIDLTETYRRGFMIIYLTLSVMLVKEKFTAQIYIWMFALALDGLIMAIANFVEARFFPTVALSVPHAISNTAVVILCAILFPFIIKGIDKSFVPLLGLESKNIWNMIWLAPTMICCMALMATWSLEFAKVSTFLYLFVRFFCFGSVIAVSYVLSEALRQLAENACLRENTRMMNFQLALQEDAYVRLSDRIAETKAARHDLRHHLSVIESLLESKNEESLNNYLRAYRDTLPDENEFTYCENYYANVIIMHYAGLAKAEGILLNVDLQIPQEIGISGPDICIVLGNCLENALEACRRMEEGQRFISVKADIRGHMLIILFDNSFNGKASTNGNSFLSLKHDGQGIGISSVKAVAERYNGTARFEFSENIFRVSVILQSSPEVMEYALEAAAAICTTSEGNEQLATT